MKMAEDRLSDNKFLLLLLLITVCALFLRIYGLSAVPLSSDDLQVISTASTYMERGHFGQTMWQHPKLRNILVYWSLQLFSGSVWGLKGVSLACGVLAVPMVGLVTRRIFNSTAAALLAAFFMAVDPLHIDFSRQAVQEVYMPFFTIVGIYGVLRYETGKGPFWLLLSGLCFGLGVAAKWYVAFPLAVALAFLAWNCLKERRTGAGWAEALFLFSVLVILPLTVYLLSYYPCFLRSGSSLSEWLYGQRLMHAETVTHAGFSPYDMELDHSPSHWFVKPVAYADFILGSGRPWVLLAIPNPLVWLLTLPAVGYLVYRGLRERQGGWLFLAALFGFSYLPLLVSSRPIWVHTSFAVLPFAFMATAFSLTDLLKEKRERKIALAAYLVLVVIVSVPLYFLATGKGEDIPLLRPVMELYRPAAEK